MGGTTPYINHSMDDPADVGEYFKPLLGAVTDCLIAIEQSEWQAKKDLYSTFQHVKLVLTQIFEKAIPVAFHTGATGMGQ